jgi:hypothetical protein
MIGIWSASSSTYLYVISGGILVLFGLPLLLTPIWWARLFRWEIPGHEHLAIYFGRCLGGVSCVLAALSFKVAATPSLQPFYFQLMIGVFGILTLVHVYGALRKIQPVIETIEIFFWALLIILTLCFYPA